ncbi:MAG TPA: hypothetical protein VGF24_30520 [Vicinamibacterales bacterium]
MREAASADERFIYGIEIVPALIRSGANAVEIAERGKKLQRAWQQALALKQLEQPAGAGSEKAVAHRWRHERAGVDQQLCGRTAGEPPFSLRVARVAKGARGHSQHAFTVAALPRQQRRVFSQQSLQAFDVVVMNHPVRLGDGPLEALAKALAHFSGEVLPASETVLTRKC